MILLGFAAEKVMFFLFNSEWVEDRLGLLEMFTLDKRRLQGDLLEGLSRFKGDLQERWGQTL